MKFIKLNRFTGGAQNPFFINVYQIVFVENYFDEAGRHHSLIHCDNRMTYQCVETPEEIVSLATD